MYFFYRWPLYRPDKFCKVFLIGILLFILFVPLLSQINSEKQPYTSVNTLTSETDLNTQPTLFSQTVSISIVLLNDFFGPNFNTAYSTMLANNIHLFFSLDLWFSFQIYAVNCGVLFFHPIRSGINTFVGTGIAGALSLFNKTLAFDIPLQAGCNLFFTENNGIQFQCRTYALSLLLFTQLLFEIDLGLVCRF